MGTNFKGYNSSKEWILGLYGGLKGVKWHEFSGVRGKRAIRGVGPGMPNDTHQVA